MRPLLVLFRSFAVSATLVLGALLIWLVPGAVTESQSGASFRAALTPLPISSAVAASSGVGVAAPDGLPTLANLRPQQSARLNVISGSGSGMYQGGDTVYVEPYRMPDMRVFDRWLGDLPESIRWPVRTQSHLTFTMPAQDLTITGTLRPAPLWALHATTTSDGARVYYQPPGRLWRSFPCSTLVLLHDAGQGADFWLRSTESRLFQRAAVARCQGILVLESTDRTTGRWDTEHTDTASNPDLARLRAAIDAAPVAGAAPLVLLGVGQGGDFAALAARAFLPLSSVRVVATVLVGSAGLEPLAGAPVRTLFMLTQRDDASLNATAAIRAWTMQAQGTPVELVELPPWPMFPARMWRIDGLTLTDTVEVYKVLLRSRIVDPQGWVARDPADLADPGLPSDLARYWPDIREQLVAGWAGHGFSTHGAETVVDFAQDWSGVPVPIPTASPTRRAYAAYIQ